jgi:hypothetical protein
MILYPIIIVIIYFISYPELILAMVDLSKNIFAFSQLNISLTQRAQRSAQSNTKEHRMLHTCLKTIAESDLRNT